MIHIDTQRKKIIGIALLLAVVAMTTQVLLPLMDHEASLEQKIAGAELKLNRLLELEHHHTTLSSSRLASSDDKASKQLVTQLQDKAGEFKIRQTMTKAMQRTGTSPDAVELKFSRVSLAMFMDYLLSLEQKGLSVPEFSLVPRGGGLVDISMTVSR